MNEDSLRYEGWRVAGASGVGLFFASLIVYTFAVLLKPLAAEFSWSREAVASAYGIMAITAAVTAPLIGHLLDRVGVRRVVVPCMFGLGIGFAALSLLTPSLWHFYAMYTLLGVFGTALSPVGYSRAVSSWFLRRRGVALAIVISGGAVAAIVQPPLTQALMDLSGWRSAYALLGGAVLIVGLPVAASFIRDRPSTVPGSRTAADGASLRQGLHSRVFWTVVVVFFASALAMNGAIVHLSALLTDRGVAPTQAALAVSSMGGASLAGRLLTGWFLDRFFAARVSVVLLSIASLGTFLLASADTFAEGALAAAMIGFGMGGEMDVTPYLLSRYFGLRSFSTLYGVAFASSAVAGAIGPILLGRAFDLSGSYESLLMQLALFTVAVAGLMLTLPRYDLRLDAKAEPA
jgi:MFS family permease